MLSLDCHSMPILAIDVGDKKIGLAIGDAETRMAFTRPALLVADWHEAWPQLQKLVGDERIDRILVGWPLNDNGSLGSQTQRVQEFIDQLGSLTSVPIIKRDERQTSIAVQREQRASDRKLRRGEEDSLAAQLLLETYLTESA